MSGFGNNNFRNITVTEPETALQQGGIAAWAHAGLPVAA